MCEFYSCREIGIVHVIIGISIPSKLQQKIIHFKTKESKSFKLNLIELT